MNEIQGEINNLVSCLTDIENGQYQPTLFDNQDTSGDDGAEMHVEALADHGLSQHEVSLLCDCELELTTIGKLEKAMREDANWHRKIKGFGPAKIDRLTDAILRLREAHPVGSD